MRKTNLLMPLGLRKNLFRLLMVLLAIGWSTSSVQAGNRADFNYRLRVKAIFGDGSPATSYVTVYGHYGAPSPAPTPSSNDYTMPSSSNSEWSNCPDLNLAGTAMNGEEFVGWYLDQACTQLLCSTLTGEIWSTSNAPGIGGINHYTTAAEADSHIQTIYAKFSFPPMDWSPYAEAPVVAGGKYYIYSVGLPGLVGLEEVSDGKILHCYKDPNKAVLFTLSDATNPEISCEDEGEKKYVNKDRYIKTSETHAMTLSNLKSDGSYMINLNNGYATGYTWSEVVTTSGTTNGRITNAVVNVNLDKQRWMFIPETTYKLFWKVKSVKENGSVTINASPTASGTTYVKFNVSGVGPVEAFDYELTDNDGHWEFGTPTCVDSVFTIPVTYTAHNVHSGTETALSTATVTLTAKNDAATHASGTVTAYVDLQPTFTMAVNELNWSTKPAGEEVYNVGMEVAASQRERLQNKLVYNTANAIAQNNATWRATIIGTNADQFKFKNGTRTVTFSPYSADSLDVIYAPTASGTHTATLHVEVSYTDANATPQTLTCVKEVTLSGKAQDVPMLTMALNGSETAFTSYTHALGDIIGTNSKKDTIDLYIHGLTSLTKSWVTNADGTFEFDVDTLSLSKANQRLVISAHRSTPVTEAANYSATLTVSGKDGNNNDVTATLTLNYRALPLTPTTVTWNWTLLNEDATYTNPITTNSDGEWTLVQKDGNGGMTYDAETKSITTEYMHHESGYKAKFELTIPQTDTYTARTDTFTATIKDNIPSVIEIKNATDFDTYVVEPTKKRVNYVTYDQATNTINGSAENVYFQWSGQSAITFDYTGPTSTGYNRTITEIYSDGTQRQIYYAPFSATNNIFTISPQTEKLWIKISGGLKDVRYFEYDTIDVDHHGVVFLEGGSRTFDVTATFANKRAVTVSLNAAAQEFFELRASGKTTGSTIVFDETDGLAVHKFVKGKKFTVAIKDGVNFAEAQAAAVNGFQVILQDNYTYNSEVVVLPIAMQESYNVTYKHSANGSYKVTYHDDMENPHTVSAEDYEHTVSQIAELSCTATLSEPAPAAGYMFRGWKVNDNLVSCKATCIVIPASGATVEPVFVSTEEAVYGIDDARFADLDEALSTAGSIAASNPVVVLLKDVTLSEPATHTIPAGVTLLIPYKDNFSELQSIPEITTKATVLSAYRTLTLKEGVNIVVNGNICVSAKIMAAGGGNKSAYPTGECGVINMANGGHIELNDGAHLYCWGYIKGQDMDQGNNTQNVGTITVNAGAIVHEDFELGDWRGGTASSNIYTYKDEKHLFPFQSYALQNVEIPTTYTYGSRLVTFMAVNTGFGSIPFSVSMIGSAETLFLLKDAGSVIRKWYDPTTDLTCYELSGTAQLDALVMNLPFVGDFNSGSCNLPVSNSMHIILADCNMTLSKPLTVQAGAVVEIKNTATIDLTAEIHLFDNDQWDKYIHNYYFRSFNNLTSHKNRGAENSKAGLEDAKFIIDGTLNVKADKGYIYSTAGGANLMGNGGGKIVFEGALPTAGNLWHVTVLNEKPYITWVPTPEAAANLCNEDGSYTRSIANASFYNIHGRWFHKDDKDEAEDHTYFFTYMIDDNQENDPVVSAVYSHDKTGLEERMKWFNVTPDANCPKNLDPEADLKSDWWLGTNPEAYYNYTMLSEWHQFIETETENVYSGSNNVLYRKAGCDWAEEGYIDENCLYTIGGVKKALVDGHFIPLTSNGYDPAYHQTDDASKYFICFTGCNWHPATPYVGESKAYTIHPENEDLHYIWFEGDWLNVLRDEPFFYTEDEQTNVRTYYEYLNGEWEIATPYVSVTDAAETRTFYMIKEAFNVASIKKNATITLLRDLPNVAEVLTYTTQNTTCTLDLNGHLLGGALTNLVTVNAPGATFTITDNTALKLGKISSTQTKAVYVQKGALVVANGTIETTAANAVEGAASTTITINGGYFAAGTKCVQTAGTCAINGGHFTKEANLVAYAAAHKYPFETTDPKYKYEVSDAWTVIFKNGETALQTLHLKPGEMPVYTANQPTKADNKFIGWTPAIVAANADVIYQAQFEPTSASESRITLNSNGGNEGLQYIYVTTGSAVGTLPEGTTKEGHTFAGWFTAASGGTQIEASTTVSADVMWYAHYTKNSYTLTWDANGGQLSGNYTSGTVEYGTAITVPEATLSGHTFLGWNATPATTMPAHDVTYTAQWSIAVKHYLQNIDGTYPETPEATENATGEAGEYITPAVKTYDGFITPATQTVRIGEATEVTYNYVRRTYTITLDANGGTCATTSLNVKHGATPTLPVATKNGVNRSGWYTKPIGGDKITDETAILYNIGTLYAQYDALNVTAPLTISEDRTVTDLRITTTGSLTIAGSAAVTVHNFILESNGATASGQFMAGYDNLTFAHAYFDLKLNAKNHQWYAVAVPWAVDATSGISVNGKTLVLGKDFDIIYYNGERRAAEGKQKCWNYVQNDGDKTLVPGRLYMIGLMGDAAVVRFEMKNGALLTNTTSVAAHPQSTGEDTDAGWNGVANPALFHAFVNPGVTEGQVYISDESRYETMPLNTTKLVVGEGAFVQVERGKSITVSQGAAFAAPRRANANATNKFDVRIAPVEAAYTDRLFVKATDSKEADEYIIGQDLVKMAVSSKVAQLWVDRYGEQLCVNTQELTNQTAYYPLGISIPQAGEYTISQESMAETGNYTLYLTYNGEVVWNLSDGAYTFSLPQGETMGYGLRIVAKTPSVATGVDEALIDAQGNTQKVLIDNKVYIIRGNNVYSADGQLVK